MAKQYQIDCFEYKEIFYCFARCKLLSKIVAETTRGVIAEKITQIVAKKCLA